MSEDDPKQLDDARFRALCLLVRDHGGLFPEELQPQIAARFFELLARARVRDASVSVVGLEVTVQVGTVTVNKRPRGRPPGRSSMVADVVDEYMAAGYSQPEARRQAAEDLRLSLRTVKRRHEQSPRRRWDGEADVT